MNLNPINSRPGLSLGGAVILAMFAALPARADYQSTVLAQGPAGYWRLNETTPPHPPITTAANIGSLGATENGTYEGSQGFFRGFPGALANSDTAVHFDGSSQYVSVPYDAALNPTTFTVEGWLAADVAGTQCPLSCGVFSSPRTGWLIYQNATSGYELRMYENSGTTFAINLVGSAATSVVGVYTHVVATFDGTTASIYLNGVLANSGTLSAPYVPGVSGPFYIGERTDGGFPWQGKADEVAFYSTALDANTIAAHYACATTNAAYYPTMILASNPLLYLRLDEAGDPPAANIGTLGSAATGTYSTGTTPGVAGPSKPPYPGFEAANYAVGVDGTGPSVNVPPLNFNTNTVTITCWVKPSSSTQTAYGGIVDCSAGTTDAGLIMDSTSGLGLGYRWNNDDNTYNWEPSTDSGLPNLPGSDWAYVALVVQPNQAAIYLCDSTNAVDWAGVTNFPPNGHPIQAFDGNTQFGWSAASGFTGGFDGTIDEVAMFDRALGEGELYTQYAAAVGGLQPILFGDLQGPSGSVAAGDPISLIVDAGGTPPLTFIWRTNGVPFATTSSNTLVIAASTLAYNASFDVIISNALNTVTSSQFPVTVVIPSTPQIQQIAGYQSRTLYPAGTLSFAASATGGGLKYQWYLNASPIASATSSAYTIASVVAANAGSYSLFVTNSVGTATSGPPAIITIPNVATNSYEAAILASAPEAWWRLDEPAGSTNMFDGMGRHPGVYTNASGGAKLPTLGVPGALVGDTNTAASFTSASQGIGLVPYSASLNTPQISAEAWVNTSVLNGQAPVSSSYGSGGWWMVSASGWWLGDSSAGTFGNDNNVNTAAAIVPGQWSHIVIQYDASRTSSGTHYPFDLYVNGQTDGYIWGGPSAGLNSGGPFIIGGQGVSATTLAALFFDGQVDEVALYTRLLSSTEIQAHYAARGTVIIPVTFTTPLLSQTVTAGKSVSFSTTVVGTTNIYLQWYKGGAPISNATNATYAIASTALGDTGTYTLWATNAAATNSISANLTVISPVSYANVTNNLVLHLTFDTDTTDSSGRGNNGTASTTTPPVFVPGIIGPQALQYTTTTLGATSGGPVTASSYVSLGTQGSGPPADLQFDTTTSFSVSLWVMQPAGSLYGDLPFIGTATNSDNNPGWVLAPGYKTGGWEWSINDGASGFNPNGTAPLINDGNWHNFVVTVDRTAKVGNTYVDGVLAASTSIASLGDIDVGNPVPVVIGQDPTFLYPEPGTATVDDIGIWRQALTPLQVAQIESAGRTSGRSFNTVGPQNVTITVARSGGNIILGYSAGTLLYSTNLGPSAQWKAVTGASPPSYTVTPTGAGNYYRVQVQ